uniref:Putative secreted protein n=1 Tax=Ixodes ricinus TaxID=34613 RepID=A0A6B0U022_IXORI
MASLAFFSAFLGSQVAQFGHRPGARASTKAPTAVPSFQSDVKLVMGFSGSLLWIQRSRRCLGVGPVFSKAESSSPSHMGREME